MVMSLISISMSLSQYRHRKRRLAGRLTHRQRRQELSQNVPMDWIEEAPYSEEEGVGNALDKIDEHPDLPPAPEVPVEPHEPELPPQKDRQRAPDDPEAQGRSNDDYMDDLMKDMGIPPEGATPPPDYDDDAPPGQDGTAPAMSRQDLDFSRLVRHCSPSVISLIKCCALRWRSVTSRWPSLRAIDTQTQRFDSSETTTTGI